MRAGEDRLVTELRSVLDDVDRALAARPAPTAPWADIQQFIRTSRTRRRRRAALAVGAVTMALVALFVAQNRWFPASREGFTPTPSSPSFAEWDHPRGSLAGDQEWLGELKTFASTHYEDTNADGRLDRSRRPGKDIQVVYASDVGDFRIAVVLGDWPGSDGRMLSEYYGPRGARAGQLRQNEFGLVPYETSGGDTHWGVLSSWHFQRDGADQDAATAGGAAFVLTGGSARTVLLQEPPTMGADGRVTQHSRQIPVRDGLAEVSVDQPGHYALVLPDLRGDRRHGYADFLGQTEDGVNPAAVEANASRGGPGRPVGLLAPGLAERTWLAARQTFAQGQWQLLVAEPGAVTRTGPARPAVGVLTLPGGARVLAAGQVSVADGQPVSGLDTALLLPAGDDAGASIAWRMDASQQHPARAAAMGPVGTASVEWTTTGGDVVTSAAVNTLAVLERAGVTGVRFLGEGGAELGRATVREPGAGRFDPLVGRVDPKTGKFDTSGPAQSPDFFGSAWLLPEVKQGLAGFAGY